MNSTILITGGAGYIGFSLAVFLLRMGHSVVVIDSLENSETPKNPHIHFYFYKGKCEDETFLQNIFERHQIDHVIHLASFKGARESHTEIAKYTRNIEMTCALLRTMVQNGVYNITFSSSAAVYGSPDKELITEDTILSPTNYYGYTKLISESIIDSFHQAYGLNYTILRYFNVVGSGMREDVYPANILPLLKRCLYYGNTFVINGNTHPTPDGTCVRDYIHITDVIQAHYMCIKKPLDTIINLASGVGTSTLEIIQETIKIVGKEIPYYYVNDQYKEPPILVGDNTKAKALINWKPTKNTSEIIAEYFNL